MKRKHFLPACTLSALLSTLPGQALAQVRVHLSQDRIELGQVVQVSFEASGRSASPPDLSPLQQDFDIVNRNFRQQSSTINGRRSQTIVLTLTLAPRRSGELDIPSLAFGGTRSPTRSIEVLATGGQESQFQPLPSWQGTPNPWADAQPQLPPFRPPPAAPDSPLLETAPVWPGAQESSSGFGSPAPVLELPPVTSGYQAPLGSSGYGGSRPATAPSAGPPTEPAFQVPERFIPVPRPAGGDSWYSRWLAGAATGVLLTLALVYWRHRRRQRPDREPTRIRSAPKPQPEPDEDPRVQALRLALQQGDATGAREELLRWGQSVWPGDPPANLSRLAMRMPGPARDAILKLDQAQYSPTPIDWKDLNAAELLQRPDSATPPVEPQLGRRAAR